LVLVREVRLITSLLTSTASALMPNTLVWSLIETESTSA
jgi:hypothetical protein